MCLLPTHDTTTDRPKLLAHCQLSCLPNGHKQKIPKITPSLSSCVRGKYTSQRPHGETNSKQILQGWGQGEIPSLFLLPSDRPPVPPHGQLATQDQESLGNVVCRRQLSEHRAGTGKDRRRTRVKGKWLMQVTEGDLPTKCRKRTTGF